MAKVSIKPGRTEIQLLARGRARGVPPKSLQVPGGLYPMKSASFQVDEYRVMSGWPVAVPDCDIRIHCLVNGEGEKLGIRDSPLALTTGADMRWVADTSYYDQTSCQWTPIQGSSSPWSAPPISAPTLVTDYEYRIGDELFVDKTALNFDSDTQDYLSINLDLAMGGTMGYTVIMAMSPNSIYGNDARILEHALWAPDAVDGSYDSKGVWSSTKGWGVFTVSDYAVWMTTDQRPRQKGVAIGNAISKAAPNFIALVVTRPQTRLYSSSGPSRVLSVGLAAGPTPVSLSTRFWLGRAPATSVGTIDMALFDLGIYGRALNSDEVNAEFTALSSVYGGDT